MRAASHNAPPSGSPGATRIVGLGASAGGLAALEKFIGQVPVGSGFAYVVVQHMDPTHEALLSTLLQRVTAMPVREVTDAMAVQPDAVYVIPPGCELTVAEGHLRLGAACQPRGRRLPIDVLFRSLARDQGPQAIGVVLSGMGADGTLGLKEIKRQGGLTLAQQPESAQFDSMPQSAIASGCVDIVALPEAMPACIARAAARPHATLFPRRRSARRTGKPMRWAPYFFCCAITANTTCRSTRPAPCSGASSGAWRCTSSIPCRSTPRSCRTTRKSWTCCSPRC